MSSPETDGIVAPDGEEPVEDGEEDAASHRSISLEERELDVRLDLRQGQRKSSNSGVSQAWESSIKGRLRRKSKQFGDVLARPFSPRTRHLPAQNFGTSAAPNLTVMSKGAEAQQSRTASGYSTASQDMVLGMVPGVPWIDDSGELEGLFAEPEGSHWDRSPTKGEEKQKPPLQPPKPPMPRRKPSEAGLDGLPIMMAADDAKDDDGKSVASGGSDDEGSRPGSSQAHAANLWLTMEAVTVRRVRWEMLKRLYFLGSGEHCSVWGAELDGKPVAVKVLKEEQFENEIALKDLDSEMQIMLNMRHAGVLSVVGVGVSEEQMPFLVLDRLKEVLSATLPKPADEQGYMLRRQAVKRWPFIRALQAGVELAEALRYCHEEAVRGFKVLHRDLKPDNIGFLPNGKLVLFDFGLAKLWKCEPGEDSTEVRMLTGQTGAARYMAPEVAGRRAYGSSAEVYSFSIILWQLLSHTRPFAGMGMARFAEQVVEGGYRPPLKKSWPPQLCALLSEGWHEEPSRRPRMADVVRRLREIIDAAAMKQLKQVHEQQLDTLRKQFEQQQIEQQQHKAATLHAAFEDDSFSRKMLQKMAATAEVPASSVAIVGYNVPKKPSPPQPRRDLPDVPKKPSPPQPRRDLQDTTDVAPSTS